MNPPTAVVAIVDDDPHMLESVGDLLRSVGFAVRVFTSAISFLSEVRTAEIDCLIVDIGMPQVNGFKLKQLVGDERPNLPVILITGNPDLLDRADANPEMPKGVFLKPFDSNELVASI